jgi:cytochrome c
MKLLLVSIAGAALVATGAAHAQSADELLKKHGCTACHAIDKKLVGPAYNDVAAKYKGDAKAPAMLMEKVKKGGVGNWGQIPMPPNAAVPDADIKTMVTYVLGLKK